MKKNSIPELENHIAFERENAGKYLDYQVKKSDEKSFDTCFRYQIGNIESDTWSCDVTLMQRGKNGEPVVERFLEQVSPSFDGDRALLEIRDLPHDAFELLVRPYVLGKDGVRRYGMAEVFYHAQEVDALGLPVLSTLSKEACLVVASDDTFIFNEDNYRHADFSDALMLAIRNTGDEETSLYRAAYFKFTLSADAVKALESVASAKLRLVVNRLEDNRARQYYDMEVHGTDTDWCEDGLNYNNYRELAATRELIADKIHCEKGCFKVDVLDYLKKQKRKDDGSLTVSFRVCCEGHQDARVIYLNSKENEYSKPSIELGYYNSIDYNLEICENGGYEPWGYAMKLADEWFGGLRDKIYPRDEQGNLIYHDELGKLDPHGYATDQPAGDFCQPVEWKFGCCWLMDGGVVGSEAWAKDKYVRTVNTLGMSAGKPYLCSEHAKKVWKRDSYGGIVGTDVKGVPTGFFHTEKHGKRTFIIDPLGNPFFAVGVNSVCLGDNENLRKYSLETYGDEASYYKEISASLKDMGITINHLGKNLELLDQDEGLANVVGLGVVGPYMRGIGRRPVAEGVWPHNNTINVFDPDFIKSAHATVGKTILEGGFADMPRVFGYTTDNEQPSGPDILERYLTLDTAEPTNSFSYAMAWTWLARRMDRLFPTLEEYQASPDYREINSEFLGFMYGRYGKVAREAVEAVDKNHMLIGSRVNGNCPSDEGYLRAAGYYLDLITTNLYGGLNPSAETITNMYRYSGKPFIVTEFYAKALDAIDANGYPLASSTGAGFLVKTQQERADFYEHYALALLESGACVGWTWYRFRDNDQGLYRQKGRDNVMYMCHVTYGKNAHVNTFMDGDVIRTADEVGEFEEIYHGEPMMTNQNANKGIYTCRFHSLVSIYHYGKDGTLLRSEGYAVEKPENENVSDGTVLKARKGNARYTLGTVKNEDGSVTKTVLTVYEGKYIPLSRAIHTISSNVMGLVGYFDGQ